MTLMPRFFFSHGRRFAVALLAVSVCLYSSCGSSSPKSESAGALSGNWQFNLTKNEPFQVEQLSVSGFLQQSSGTLTGSVQGPTTTSSGNAVTCGGTGLLTGSITNQSVSFTLNAGGTAISFTGVIASGQTSMSGSYQALGGACYPDPTSGTWTASLIPPLNGTFTGTIDSQYMGILGGSTATVPVSVSGSFAQTTNAGSSTATLTGTITAVGYPCFTTASLAGTISGQNIYLSVYGYNGLQIGTIGQVQAQAVTPTPATFQSAASPATGWEVTGNTNANGFSVSLGNPCPAINNNGNPLTTDPVADPGSDAFMLNVQLQ
jgi:hypothetical protein